uniref:Uncharacterized protein n=1 Tax=Pseudenhygromyxa salsuginis TaxID=442868 RepID=A0A3Q8I355_9BACT|nr:hypothetical protein [Pseudenhygromyxa salsuginis]
MSEDFNPYAAPSVGAEQAEQGVNFALSEEQRKLLQTTATIMLVAGGSQLAATALNLVIAGVNVATVVTTLLMGLVPVFVLIAGLTLRRLGQPGNDREALVQGLRQLFLAFLIKGSALLLVIGLGLLTVLSMVLGLGRGLLGF